MKVKPFVKWVGGKSQLLEEISKKGIIDGAVATTRINDKNNEIKTILSRFAIIFPYMLIII